MKVIKFEQSKKISTYLYALVAGPYTFIESNQENLPKMKIFMRKSVLPDVKNETLQEMFMIT
jgi:aminopeptidase N